MKSSTETIVTQAPSVAVTPQPTATPVVHRWDLINRFIAKRNYARYLEIGTASIECFGKIEVRVKVRIEASSLGDDLVRLRDRGESYDLIFVDRPEYASAYRDVEQGLACLAPGGCVMMRNCMPRDEAQGTAWRAFVMFREYDELDAIVVDLDGGIGLLRKIPNPLPILIGKQIQEIEYSDIASNFDAWIRPQPLFVMEQIAERPWGKPTVAILVIGKSDEEIAEFKQKSPWVEQEARMVYMSNPARRYGATAVIANPFLESATEDVVAVVHADTSFAPGAIDVFAQAAIDNECLTGIVGRAKGRPGAADMGYTWCTGVGGYVSTLDSCSVFFRRSLGLRFDGRTFDDFHCVVEDLCLQARLRGIRSLVPKAEAGHIGTATEPTWNDNFWRYRQRLLDKYPDQEIHTV